MSGAEGFLEEGIFKRRLKAEERLTQGGVGCRIVLQVEAGAGADVLWREQQVI